MKRLLLLAMSLLLLAPASFSQYFYNAHTYNPGNPGSLNSDGEFPAPPGWTQLYTGATTTPTWSSVGFLPFAFSFNGQAVTSYKVSNTGVLTFTTNATSVPSASNTTLPSNSIPNNSVCIWGLLGSGSNDIIESKTFGTAPNRQHWIQFTSFNHPTGGTNCWAYWAIVLEESTNDIYLVDQRNSGDVSCQLNLTLGIQINTSNFVQVVGSPNINNLAGTDATDADNQYYRFQAGVQPTYDAAVLDIDLPSVASTNQAPFTIEGTLANWGVATITSMTLNYSINGGTPVSTPLSGLSISTDDFYNYSHSIPWNPTSAGNYTVTAWASNINGNQDQNTSNDVASHAINVGGASVNRVVLHESFCSSTAPPCAASNPPLKALLDANAPDRTIIAYPMNWPGIGDPYYTLEGGDRRNYYTNNAVPNLFVDGGFNDHPANYDQPTLNNFKNVPCYMNITGNYTVNGQTVDVTMTIDPIQAYPSTTMKAHMVIVENYTTGNVSTNGETEFFHIMKKMLPNASGTLLSPLAAGSPVTLTQTYTFPTGHTVEDFDSLSVVLFVQDDANFQVHQSAWATSTLTLNLSATVTDASCAGGSDGSIDLTVTGGTSPYTYAWSNGATTEDLPAVAAGTYTITVTDAIGTTTVTSYTLAEPAPIQVSVTTSDATCGNTDGAALASVSSGASPYTYAWSNGTNSATLTNVGAGVYTLTVTDANGCSTVETVSIANQNGPSATITAVDPTCSGSADGSAIVNATGGTTPYAYAWNNGGTSSILTNLPAGAYVVSVTDAAGCIATASVTLNAPPALVTSASSTDATCGQSDGSATIAVLSGPAPFSYQWDDPNNSTTATVNNLSAGTYNVTITDGGGCTTVIPVNVNNQNGPVATVNGVDVTCDGAADGAVSVNASGGTSPYTYAWNDPGQSTTAIVPNLPAGTYTVTVTDANGCLTIGSVTISAANPSPTVNLGPDVTIVSGGSATLDAGAGFSSYLWSDGSTNQTLVVNAPGTYSVTVTGANGCTGTDSIDVTVDVGIDLTIIEDGFTLFPNPTQGKFTLEAKGALTGDVQLIITNAQGQVIQQSRLNVIGSGFQHEIDLSGQARGIYLVRMVSGNKSSVKRISLL